MTSKEKIQNGDTNQSDDGGLYLRCSSLSFRDTIYSSVLVFEKYFLFYKFEVCGFFESEYMIDILVIT